MTARPDRRSMAGALALLGAFVAGAGLALLVRGAPTPSPVGEGPAPTEARRPGPSSEGPPPGPGSDLLEGLDLTADQRAAVDSILGRLRTVSDSTFRRATLHLREETERARRGIRAELTDDQARLFDRRILEQRALRVRRVQVGDSVVRTDTLPRLDPGG